MIKIKNSIAGLLIASLVFTIFNSCKKVDKTPPSTPMGTLEFHIHTQINDTEVDSGVVATDANGRRFQLNIAQFYLSNIILKKSDGTSYPVKDAYIMKYIGEEAYVVGMVPAGNYSSVSFDVGVDATANATNPTSHPDTSALSIKDPSMWFGTTAQGYMFVNVLGLADTSATNNGNVDSPFSYQLGTAEELKHVDMPAQPFMVLAMQTQFVHMIADYGALLEGVNFKTQSTATPFMNSTVAAQVSVNVSKMFRYEM